MHSRVQLLFPMHYCGCETGWIFMAIPSVDILNSAIMIPMRSNIGLVLIRLWIGWQCLVRAQMVRHIVFGFKTTVALQLSTWDLKE